MNKTLTTATRDLPQWRQEIKTRLGRICGKGWSVSENRGGTRLRIRHDGSQKDYQLDIEFGAHNVDALVDAVSQIHGLVLSGQHDVTSALQQLRRQHTIATDIGSGIDWAALLKDYEQHKRTNKPRVCDKTWASYQRDLSVALELLSGKGAPTRTFDLIDRTQLKRGLKGGKKALNECLNHVNDFLDFGVTHRNLPSCWAPLGTKEKDVLRAEKWTAERSVTLSDRQMLELVDSIQNPLWQNVTMMLAAFGLRPFELHHLSVRINDEGEEQLWCSYEKKAGKGKTAPRWIVPIYPRDDDGIPANWNLVFRFKTGQLSFPPLKDQSSVARFFSRDCRLFKQWRKEAEESRQVLQPYCFRHSYSARGHHLGLPSGVMADLMGHSFQTHCREYAYVEKESTQALLKRLLGAQAVGV